MRTRVNDADNRVDFRDVLRLNPILECGPEAARGRLLDDDRLRRRKLDLGDGGNLGDWRLRRRDESEGVSSFWMRRRGMRARARDA